MKLTHAEESVLVFAARYAHDRKTGAANYVVSAINSNWDNISLKTKAQLTTESKEATCNFEDWEKIGVIK